MTPVRLVAAAFWLSAGHSPVAPTLAQYVAQIHHIRVVVDQQVALRTSGPALVGVERRLAGLGTVRLPDGAIVHTSCPQIAVQLRAGAGSDQLAARQSLDRLDDNLQGQTIRTIPSATLRELDSVLLDARFHPQRNLLQRAQDWLGEQLNRLLDGIAGLLGRLIPTNPQVPLGLQLIPAAMLLIVLAGIAILIARTISYRLVNEPRVLDAFDEPTTSRGADDRELRYAGEGDYRSALRYLLLALLLRLQERGLLELRPGLTNREYLRELPDTIRFGAAARSALVVLVDAFDRSWYGHQRLDLQQYEQYRALARIVSDSAAGERIA